MNDSDIKKIHKPLAPRGLFINRDVNCEADYCRVALSREPHNAGSIIRLVRCLQAGAQIKEVDLFGTSFRGASVNQVNRLQLTIELCREALRLAPHNPAIKERLVKLVESQSPDERLLALAQHRHRVQAEIKSEFLTEKVDPRTVFKSWTEESLPPTQFYPLVSGKLSYKK